MSYDAFRRRLRPMSLLVILALGALAFVSGCGGDDDSSSKNAEDVQNSLAGLTEFGTSVLNEPAAQIIALPAVTSLIGAMPLPIPSLGAAAAALANPTSVPRAVSRVFQSVRLRPRAHPQSLSGFGTYTYDANSTADPFPNWVLATANVPAGGYVFRFDGTDGFTTIDPVDSSEVAMQGEVRFLGLVLDEGVAGTADDILTHAVFEVAGETAGSDTPLAYPTLVHIGLTMTLDANREPVMVRIGDKTANGSSDPDAAYLGGLLLALEVDLTNAPPLMDLSVLLQVYDSAADFVVRVAGSANDVNQDSSSVESLTLTFGYGETTTPASPPWIYTATIDNFRPSTEDPESDVADINGKISFNGDKVAGIAGTTDPADVDGDGEPDCVDTWVTFVSAPDHPVSICVVGASLLQAFGALLPT